jgi:hypothetical protein
MHKKLLDWTIWLLWLALVIAWNYGVPQADPLYDVVVAVVLSFAAKWSTKILMKNK